MLRIAKEIFNTTNVFFTVPIRQFRRVRQESIDTGSFSGTPLKFLWMFFLHFFPTFFFNMNKSI